MKRVAGQGQMKAKCSGWQTSRPSILLRTQQVRGHVPYASGAVAAEIKKFSGVSPEVAQVSAPPTSVDGPAVEVSVPEVPAPSAAAPALPFEAAAPTPLPPTPAVPAPTAATDLSDVVPQVTPSVPSPEVSMPQFELPKFPTDVSDNVTAQSSKALEDLSTQFFGAQQSASGALSGVQESASDVFSGVQQSATGALSGVQESASGVLSGVQESASGVLSGVQESASGVLSGVTSALTGATGGLSEVQGSAAGVLNTALSSFDEVSSSALQSAGGLAKDLSSLTQGATDSVASSLQLAQSALEDVTSSSTSTLNSLLSAVQAQTAQSSAQLQSAVSGVQTQVLTSLPEPVRGPLRQGVDAVTSTVTSHPGEVAIAAGVVGATYAINNFLRRFSAISGELEPSAVLAMLAEDDMVLVDTRSDEARERDGIPELKYDARFKVAALPPAAVQDVLRSSLRQVKNQTELVSDVTATLVRGLSIIKSPLTKVAILSERGDRNAVELARTLRKSGQSSAFVVAGGFQRWAKEGLPVKEGVSTYDVKPGEVLADSFERLTGQLGGAGAKLSSPLAAVPFVAATAAAGVAVVNYRIVLEYIGLFATFYGGYRLAKKYDSPQAAWKDLTGFLPKPRPATAVAATTSRPVSPAKAIAPKGPTGSKPAAVSQPAAATPSPVSAASDAEAAPTKPAAALPGVIETPLARVDESQVPAAEKTQAKADAKAEADAKAGTPPPHPETAAREERARAASSAPAAASPTLADPSPSPAATSASSESADKQPASATKQSNDGASSPSQEKQQEEEPVGFEVEQSRRR